MTTQLTKYIRNENNRPRGVAVAVRNGDKIEYGYSLWNPVDKWDKKLGIKKALARAAAGEYNMPVVPERLDAVLKAFYDLEERSYKYFKDIKLENVKLKGHVPSKE